MVAAAVAIVAASVADLVVEHLDHHLPAVIVLQRLALQLIVVVEWLPCIVVAAVELH